MIWSDSIHLTRDQFELKRKELKKLGVDVDGDCGQIKHGLPFGSLTLNFDYAEPKLDLELIDCPRLERGIVENTIREWFS